MQGWRKVWLEKKPASDCMAWFHVSSLGEFEQARPVISQFRKEHPEYCVWLTFFSPSGYEVRKDTAEADCVTYMPMDTPRNARRIVELINPSVVFFVKYDFWFNTLRELQSRNIPVFIFSAIFRPSQYFFKPYGKWYARQLGSFNHIFVQNEESMELLRNNGITKCSIAGDTRFDRVREIALAKQRDATVERFLGCGSDSSVSKCVIAGSSWEPDERNLNLYSGRCPVSLKLILAPHVISEEHLAKIENLFGKDICIRYSKVGENYSYDEHRNIKVLIIDNIGLLSRIYGYADVAYIGGGFGHGIHNILEAVTYAKPVVFGPNHKKFQEAMDILRLGGGWSYSRPTELFEILDRLLTDEDANRQASETCRKYLESNIGSTDRIVSTVNKYLSF